LRALSKRKKGKIKTDSNQQKYALPSKENEYRRDTTTIRTPVKGYQHIFLGYCFSCNNFGHKVLHCRAYGEYNHKNVQRYGYKNKKNYNNQENINIIHSLHYKITMLTNATTIVTNLVIVDYQSIP
jgi:hypothetical protein